MYGKRLSDISADKNARLNLTIKEAMEITGTDCPSQAKKKLSEHLGKKLQYRPHVGAKQRAKAAKRMQMASTNE